MRRLLIPFLTVPLWAAGPVMPPPQLTPGAVGKMNRMQVCDPGLIKTFSYLPMSTQTEVLRRYGNSDTDLPNYNVDHLIPLGLGGTDDLKVLWPRPYEPRPGAHEKARLGQYLQQPVCNAKMSLKAAQEAIRRNWYAAYHRMSKQQPSE